MVVKMLRTAPGKVLGIVLSVACAAFAVYLLRGWTSRSEVNLPVVPTVAATATSVKGDMVRLAAEQMHQIELAKVEIVHFRVMKTAIGQIAFNEDASTMVLAPYSGRVTRVIAKVGDVLKRGDALFEIESPEVVQTQLDLIAAVQVLEKSKSQFALAKRALDRATSLFANKITPEREVEKANNDYAAAESDLRTAEGAVSAARNRLRVLVGRSDAEVARLERERLIDPRVTINAPIDGTVIARKVGPGQYVRTDSGDALFAITDLGVMWLKANVSENDISYIRIDQDIEVSVTAIPGRTFNARIIAIGAASDSATRRIVVRSEIPNPDGVLKSEMFATFKIVTASGEPSLAVPVDSVIWDGGQAALWVEAEPMVYTRRAIKAGLQQNGRMQVLSGLQPGDTVVGRGALFIDNEWRK
jgi:membrane fusion protein, heavy metal efflux system